MDIIEREMSCSISEATKLHTWLVYTMKKLENDSDAMTLANSLDVKTAIDEIGDVINGTEDADDEDESESEAEEAEDKEESKSEAEESTEVVDKHESNPRSIAVVATRVWFW